MIRETYLFVGAARFGEISDLGGGLPSELDVVAPGGGQFLGSSAARGRAVTIEEQG